MKILHLSVQGWKPTIGCQEHQEHMFHSIFGLSHTQTHNVFHCRFLFAVNLLELAGLSMISCFCFFFYSASSFLILHPTRPRAGNTSAIFIFLSAILSEQARVISNHKFIYSIYLQRYIVWFSLLVHEQNVQNCWLSADVFLVFLYTMQGDTTWGRSIMAGP